MSPVTLYVLGLIDRPEYLRALEEDKRHGTR